MILDSFRKYVDPHVFLTYARNAAPLQRVAALVRTGLVDQLAEELKQVPNAPAGLVDKVRAHVEQAKADTFTPEVQQFLQHLSDVQLVETMSAEEVKQKFPFASNNTKYNKQQMLKLLNEKVVAVKPALVDNAFKASQLYYDLGQYEKSLHVLDQLQYFVDTNERFDNLHASVLWGRINLRLLTQLHSSKDERKFQLAFEELKRLPASTPQLQTTLLHIALLLLFTSPDPPYDHFLEQYVPDFQRALFTHAPALLPHFYVASLLAKTNSGDFSLDSIANLLEANADLRTNPIADFVYQLLSQFDFQASNQLIPQIAEYVQQDFLLLNKKDAIVRGAQILHFQTYFRIYNYVSISSYSHFLSMSADDAEVWLVDAIRTLNIQARIDGDRITVIQQAQDSPIDQIMGQLKDIIPKTNMLITNLQRLSKQ